MSLLGSLSISLDIDSSADKFYSLWRTQAHLLPDISESIQKAELLEGDWDVDGSIQLWTYILDGKSLTEKEKVSFDDENKSVTFDIIEGDLLKEFKSFKVVMKVIPKADGKSRVTWRNDYETKAAEYIGIGGRDVLQGRITQHIDSQVFLKTAQESDVRSGVVHQF